MKPLLIHNDNTYLLKNFHDNSWFSEKFIPTAKTDIDVQLTTFINNRIADKNISAIFIKSTLSVNYLEFLGLRLGIHIRLSNKLPNIQNLPIVFLGEETLEEICKIYAYPEIFYSSGTFISPENFTCIQVFFDLIANNSLECCTNIDLLIKKLNIDPPANYLSHHSIANEWSILRWAKVLGIATEKEALKDVRINIESLLYYKFLQAKYPIEAEPDKAAFKINGKGRILYIDDEWNKGWDVVLEKFVSSSPDIVFETLKYDFKDKTHEEILAECKKKIASSNPDAVLLDLRLSDSDFTNSHNSLHLTGYKVLKAIKLINPGIQVIIFTASNKVWNFTELQNAGCDDFVLKESPDLSTDAGYSRNAINKMASSVSNAFQMSFLKKVYLKMAEIEKQITVANNEEEADFLLRLKNNLNVAFKLLIDTKISAKYFNYAYLQLFQIVEDFSKLSYVFKESSDSYVCVNDKEVLVQKTLYDKWESAISFDGGKYRLANKIINTNPKEKIRRLDTNYKVSAILIFRLGFENSSFLKWTDIYTNRNTKAAHFNIDDALNEEAIFTLLDFIKNFISPNKQKETNIGMGLTVKSFEESVELLKSHFKK